MLPYPLQFLRFGCVFFCLVIQPRISHSVLSSNKNTILILLLILEGKQLVFLPLIMMFVEGIYRCYLSSWINSLLFLVCWVFFQWEMNVKFCSKISPCIYWDENSFSFFHMLNYIDYCYFLNVDSPWIDGVNPTWSRCILFFICSWNWLVKNYLNFLHEVSRWILPCGFLVIFLSDLNIRIILTS